MDAVTRALPGDPLLMLMSRANERLAPRILLRDDNEDGAGSDHRSPTSHVSHSIPRFRCSGSPKGLLCVTVTICTSLSRPSSSPSHPTLPPPRLNSDPPRLLRRRRPTAPRPQ